MRFLLSCYAFSFLPYSNFVSLPSLKKCQIFSKELVDPLMVNTYAELPKLPRYALHVAVHKFESLTIYS